MRGRTGKDLRRRRHIQPAMIERELTLGRIEGDLHLNSRYYKNDRATIFIVTTDIASNEPSRIASIPALPIHDMGSGSPRSNASIWRAMAATIASGAETAALCGLT